MTRDKQIKNVAWDLAEGRPNTLQFQESFILGTMWADNNPSDEVIKKILDLAWEYNASDVDVNNLTPEGEFNYVKEHLNNNK